jgi:hypothetical protein
LWKISPAEIFTRMLHVHAEEKRVRRRSLEADRSSLQSACGGLRGTHSL